MRLEAVSFESIKNGNKKYEIRVNDEKRKKISVGDKIEFLKRPGLKEKLVATVADIKKFPSFAELFRNLDAKLYIQNSKSINEYLKMCREFYSIEEEEKYGIVAIGVEIK